MKGSSVKSRIFRGISPAEVSSSPQKHAASSASTRKYRSENVDPNICVEVPPPKPPVPKARSPLPLRPPLHPGSNPLKRKLSMESLPENGVPASFDSGVKVVVRMRPGKEEEGEQIVTKISADSVSILDHVFTFDFVADSDSTQQDIFELVGVPLVENCLDGFNSSIFAYGQTGSGKTYTMWGPTNELLEEENSQQKGLTPRVFERLFSRINEMKHADKELTYQCRCSFLEIYNEQITDLLDPNQKNLQIREDVKSGVYVEDLTEECVYDMKDLTKLLIKGLTNRRTGATSINADSSRSHSVFTCVVESRSKNKADGVSSLRVSRINLVDLAGSERQKLTGAAGERLKEAGNINRSLSQLGNLINILAEVSQSGKQRHIPYRDSRLTFLLQESLGGNAKLAMICAISPAQSCKSETFSTLRFAQRAKAIKNKAMVNELRQEDVDSLREIIRQLRDELVRVKSNGNALDCNARSSTGWNARRSLSLLKKSLSHPMTMAIVDEDSDEEMEIDEEAVEKLCVQVGLDPPSMQDPQALSFNQIKTDNNLKSEETDVNMEDFQEEVHEEAYDANVAVDTDTTRLNHEEHVGNVDEKIASPAIKDLNVKVFSEDLDDKKKLTATSNLSIETCCSSPGLDSSLISVSPKVNHTSRKSPRMSSTLSASQIHKSECGSDVFNSCSREGNGHSPTQYLEASLNRGLQIIDSHCQNGALRRSSFRFPVKPVEMKPTPEKADVSVQTVWEGIENVKDASSAFICCQCKSKVYDVEEFHETKNVDDLSLVPMDKSEATTSLVPSDESHDTEKLKIHIPKAVEKVLAGAIRREMALEDICAKKTTEITHLNRLVQQYKHERECNAIIQQTREDKIHRLESLMDGVLPSEDFMDEEFLSLANEHKLLKEKYEYHPEVLGMKVELERVQDELDRYRNFFDMGEKDVLMEEIKDLRSQLQYYVDSSTNAAPNHKGFMLQLTYPCQHDPAPPLDTNQDMVAQNIQEQFEHERCQWTEMESKWISLSEELRLDLEASRSLAEKMRNELDAEKKCGEELKEALQMAMQGHAHILDQYADLQEKHIALLARHRKIQDGIVDVKRAAAKAGVKGAESKFIDSLASEISALKAEREKERRYWRDENKGLQQQLRDTVEAVQAAGELLVRLKETEEAVAIAEKRALMAEQEAKKAKKENDDMKKKHEREMATLNQFLAESRLPKEAIKPFSYNETEQTDAKYDGNSLTDQRWREEFEPFCNEPGPSLWFSGYDQCNL